MEPDAIEIGDARLNESLYLLRPGARVCEIDASHKWGLPGTTCPQCNATWSTTGLDYPALDLSEAPFERELRRARLASWEEYESLRKQVATLLPSDTLLHPGAEFGALIGRSRGPRFGAIWPNPWTLMFAADSIDRLLKHTLVLPPIVEALIKDKADRTQIFEAALAPLWMIDSSSFVPGPLPCTLCKRDGRKLSGQIRVRIDSLPSADLVRAADFTTRIFVTDRFKHAAEAEQIEGIVFERVVVLT